MDHLPHPYPLQTPPVRVPYLGLAKPKKEKHTDFSRFLEQFNLTPDYIAHCEYDEKNGDYVLSAFQEWTFFALLKAVLSVFGCTIDTESFIRTDDDGFRWVTTAYLPHIVRQIAWQRFRTHCCTNHADGFQHVDMPSNEVPTTAIIALQRLMISNKQRQEEHDRVIEYLNIVVTFLRRYTIAYSEITSPPHHDAIRLCSHILCETLQSIADQLLFPDDLESTLSPLQPAKFLAARFRSGGWCPRRIENMYHSSASCTYTATLYLPNDHRSHKDCTSYRCIENVTAQEASALEHYPLYCSAQCLNGERRFSVKDQDIISTLDSGSWPILTMETGHDGVELTVVSADKGPNFVAISHVWSHGLGSPTRNALPHCQIQRLHQLLSRISGGPYALWIDTLCVPPAPHLTKYRSIAISRMRRIYSEAAYVLVLDKDLVMVGNDYYERCVKLLCSEWTGRLWTLQEALLPSRDRLLIQFRNAAISLEDLIVHRQLSSDVSEDSWDVIRKCVGPYWDTVKDLAGSQLSVLTGNPHPWHNLVPQLCIRLDVNFTPLPRELLALRPSLQARSVTRAEDEPICLSVLLDLPFDHLKTSPTMEYVYRKAKIHENILFADGRRLASPGFRWAPRSFLETVMPIWGAPEYGTLTNQGFQVSKAGVRIHGNMSLGFSPREVVIYRGSRPSHSFLTPASTAWPAERIKASVAAPFEDSGLIFESDIDTPRSVVNAVFISNVPEIDSTLYCHCEFHVALVHLDPNAAFTPRGRFNRIDGTYESVRKWIVD